MFQTTNQISSYQSVIHNWYNMVYQVFQITGYTSIPIKKLPINITMTSHHRSPPISEDSTIISLSAATGLFSWRLRENKTGISHDLTDKLCFFT